MELNTHRLILRDLTDGDEERIARFQRHPDVRRYVLRSQATDEYATFFVKVGMHMARYTDRPHYHFAIALATENRLIGTCSFAKAMYTSPNATVGWTLDRNYWGCGYATETVSRLLEFGFETLGEECIVADCFAANAASRRVMEKAGMQQVQSGKWYPWYLALRYQERRPVVRYALDRAGWRLPNRRDSEPISLSLPDAIREYRQSRCLTLPEVGFCLHVPHTTDDFVVHNEKGEDYIFLFDNDIDAQDYAVAAERALGFRPGIIRMYLRDLHFRVVRFKRAGYEQQDLVIAKHLPR